MIKILAKFDDGRVYEKELPNEMQLRVISLVLEPELIEISTKAHGRKKSKV